MRFTLPALLFVSSVAAAEPPRIAGVFPPGATVGTSVEVTVRGTDLDAVTGLRFAQPGLTAAVVPPPPEPKPDPKKKPKKPDPTAATTATFRVSVAEGVPPGGYDVRVVTKGGVSNPRLFTVGRLPEVNEAEPNDAAEADPDAKTGPRPQRVALGTTVNGLLSGSTDVDYVVVAGRAGQRLLAHCAAPSIDSRAVPLVEIFAPDGRRLATSRNPEDADALADAKLPADGDYLVRVTEFAYQGGGPDSFYRLTVGTMPRIDAVVPPVVPPGKTSTVTVYGRNLPGGKPVPGSPNLEQVTTTVDAPKLADGFAFPGRVTPAVALSDGFAFRLPKALDPAGVGNAVPLFLSDGKLVGETAAPHGTPETAAKVPVPCEVLGTLATRSERDFFTFAAKKGDPLVIDAAAERFGSDVDLLLRVRDAKGREIAGELDDDPDALHPNAFPTRCGDPPAFRLTAPADGDYTVLVTAADGAVNSGPRCAYRLRVGPPAPDFRAVVMPRGRDEPAAANVLADGDAGLDVFIDRRDGFDGPVTVTATGLPAGVSVTPLTLHGDERWAVLVLRGAAKLADGVQAISVTATAEVAGKPVTRVARPATVVRGVPGQRNAASVARLDSELVVATRAEKAPLRLTADAKAIKFTAEAKGDKPANTATHFYARRGDKLTLPVAVERIGTAAKALAVAVTLEPTQLARNGGSVVANNNQPLALPKEKAAATLPVEVRSNAAPGDYLLVIRAETTPPKKGSPVADAYATPITLTVLPPEEKKAKK
jgi:hypothetical protein